MEAFSLRIGSKQIQRGRGMGGDENGDLKGLQGIQGDERYIESLPSIQGGPLVDRYKSSYGAPINGRKYMGDWRFVSESMEILEAK